MSDSDKKAKRVGRTATETEFVYDERKRLAGKSKDELIELVIDLRLKNQSLSRSTSRVEQITESDTFSNIAFGTKADTGIEKFTRLPADPDGKHTDTADTAWRIKLISNNAKHKPLGLEIYDDVIIGRSMEGSHADLDLSEVSDEDKGISRQHAVFRPSKTSLYLIDLYSTNGTFVNGSKLSPSVAQKIKNKDVISFGSLHFVVRIVSMPAKPGS